MKKFILGCSCIFLLCSMLVSNSIFVQPEQHVRQVAVEAGPGPLGTSQV